MSNSATIRRIHITSTENINLNNCHWHGIRDFPRSQPFPAANLIYIQIQKWLRIGIGIGIRIVSEWCLFYSYRMKWAFASKNYSIWMGALMNDINGDGLSAAGVWGLNWILPRFIPCTSNFLQCNNFVSTG